MNTDSLKYHLLNGQTNEQFISLLFWAYMGLILSLLIEVMRHKNKIGKVGFSLKFWAKDNIVRMVVSNITIIIGISFTKELIGHEIGNWGSFLSGLATDKIIEALIKFQSVIVIKKSNLSK